MLKISELGLALAVNTGAIREAQARLTAEGLVSAILQRGFRVAPVSATGRSHRHADRERDQVSAPLHHQWRSRLVGGGGSDVSPAWGYTDRGRQRRVLVGFDGSAWRFPRRARPGMRKTLDAAHARAAISPRSALSRLGTQGRPRQVRAPAPSSIKSRVGPSRHAARAREMLWLIDSFASRRLFSDSSTPSLAELG
ncbi:hypothetical protein [Bradyrhizobium sp.]|uniref:hypothetical protein n=1 Tax=Bradyrhizobium sp. TaxID=376 RepID=UPI002DDD2426|nr:hypothetical protein [Bradyrhizobium sp.]HEV2160471.1 hypothetical protein [Bradyrhizobium sp.]